MRLSKRELIDAQPCHTPAHDLQSRRRVMSTSPPSPSSMYPHRRCLSILPRWDARFWFERTLWEGSLDNHAES